MWCVQGIVHFLLGGHAHWYHLANIVVRLCMAAVSGSATKGDDVACYQITLGNFVIFIYCDGFARIGWRQCIGVFPFQTL